LRKGGVSNQGLVGVHGHRERDFGPRRSWTGRSVSKHEGGEDVWGKTENPLEKKKKGFRGVKGVGMSNSTGGAERRSSGAEKKTRGL